MGSAEIAANLNVLDKVGGMTAGYVGHDTTAVHDIFGDGSCEATYTLESDATDLGGTHDGVVSGPTFVEGKYGNCAAYDTAANDRIITLPMSLNTVFESGLFSVSLWVNISAFRTYGTMLFTINDSANSYPEFFIESYDDTNQVRVGRVSAATSIILSDSPIQVGKWCHIVVTVNVDGGKLNIYMDNVLENEFTDNVGNPHTYDRNPEIGNRSDYFASYSGLDGRVDHVRVFNKVVTSDEVAVLYNELSPQVGVDLGSFLGHDELFIDIKGI